ncbi:unnamed protein product [Penicillium nalgiovense]|nr:unnamed protein product [Penicillium nalgiovense]
MSTPKTPPPPPPPPKGLSNILSLKDRHTFILSHVPGIFSHSHCRQRIAVS